jgi:hypothetical protein
MTWLRVETAMGPFRPMARSYIFNLERDVPTLLACYFPGPVPLSLLLMPFPHGQLGELHADRQVLLPVLDLRPGVWPSVGQGWLQNR